MRFHVQATESLEMTFAVGQSEGPRVNSGLEQGCTIPFFIREVCGNFGSATLFTEKQIPHQNGVIPSWEMCTVVPHGFESLAQSLGKFIQYKGSKLEIVKLLVRERLQSHPCYLK